MQTIFNDAKELAAIFDRTMTVLKANGLGKRERAQLLRVATLVNKAEGILLALIDDETEKPKKEPKPKAEKKPARAKAARAHAASVKRSR
jgi:hypothetical protein